MKKLSVTIWCDLAGDEGIFTRGVVAQHGFRKNKHGVRERFAKNVREEWPLQIKEFRSIAIYVHTHNTYIYIYT